MHAVLQRTFHEAFHSDVSSTLPVTVPILHHVQPVDIPAEFDAKPALLLLEVYSLTSFSFHSSFFPLPFN